MKKIPTIFLRDFAGTIGAPGRMVTREPDPACGWVFAGEGVATRKYDGTCVLVRDDTHYKRYEVKKGGTPPAGFEPANDVDPETGKQQGWVLIGSGPEDKWHREALGDSLWGNGTFELIGPKVQGNPEKTASHQFVPHSEAQVYPDFPRDFDGIKAALTGMDVEGVVFHHPDGRMAKIKKKDFGLPRCAI